MIPVRVPANAMPVQAGDRRFRMSKDHPMYYEPCPACGRPLAGQQAVLVLAGIRPEDRRPGGWATGGAVVVHARCAGLEEI